MDASSDARRAVNEPRTFEGKHHVVNRGGCYAEELLHISLGRRSAIDARISVDESQVLALFFRKVSHGRHVHFREAVIS